MQLRIEVRIDAYNDPAAQGNLFLSETVNIDTPSFMEIAQILCRFHQLAGAISEERKAND